MKSHRELTEERLHFTPMNNKKTIALVSAGLAFFLLSCTLGAALVPPPTVTPTAAPSETPQPAPTATPLVDLTPPTPVPTATGGTQNSPDYWACKIRSQVPKDGVKVDPKEHFDVAWQIENFGYGTWEPDGIRVTYFSGTRMQVSESVRLKESVATDRWTQFVVPMVVLLFGQVHHRLGAVARG